MPFPGPNIFKPPHLVLHVRCLCQDLEAEGSYLGTGRVSMESINILNNKKKERVSKTNVETHTAMLNAKYYKRAICYMNSTMNRASPCLLEVTG